jgi:acyl carrier protein
MSQPSIEKIVTVDTLDQADPAIWEKVRAAFADALALDVDEVELHHEVIGDLGAESLDFLDVAYRLERAFDIKIPRGGIESTAKSGMGDDAYEVAGVLTAPAIEKLAEAMPEVPREKFVEGLRTAEVASLFRVATFYNLVVHLLNEKSRAA